MLLLILLSAYILTPGSVTASDGTHPFCDSLWTLDTSGLKCLRLYKGDKYLWARNFCERMRGGQLVEIYGNETNTLVKDLLTENNIEAAWIGLSDLQVNGIYVWATRPKKRLGNFTDWVDPSNPNTSPNSAVYISQGGWQEGPYQERLPFVCEKPFKPPTVTVSGCQSPVEEDKPASFHCSAPAGGWQHVRWTVGGRDVSSATAESHCDRNDTKQCSTATVPGNATVENTININETPRDAPIWCNIMYYPGLVARGHCRVQSYYPPSLPTCSHSFNELELRIICVTEKVYPRAKCVWRTPGGNETRVSSRTLHGYFKTECTSVYRPTSVGSYIYTVTMWPELDGLGRTHQAAVNGSERVQISLPTEPPKFKVNGIPFSQGVIPVSENESVSLACDVIGGQPSVYQAILDCDAGLWPRTSEKGTTVSVGSKVMNRSLGGKGCLCLGKHIGSSATLGVTLSFDVLYPMTVSGLSVSGLTGGGHGVVEVSEGRNRVDCGGDGNPWPSLSLEWKRTSLAETSLAEKKTTTMLTYDLDLGCEDWGEVACIAKSSAGFPKGAKSLQVRVKCKPRYVSLGSNLPYGIPLPSSTPSVVTIGGFVAYPEPNSVTIYKGVAGFVRADSSRFSATFVYTNMPRGKVEIIVNGTTVADLGPYRLHLSVSSNSSLYHTFELGPTGPPICPSEVKASPITTNFTTLHWTPGHDGGLTQTFTVTDDTTGEVKGQLPEPPSSRSSPIVLNMTDLQPDTEYTLIVGARNQMGEAVNCLENRVSFRTKMAAIMDPTPSHDVVIVVVVVVAIIILIIAATVIAFVCRRRRKFSMQRGVPTDRVPVFPVDADGYLCPRVCQPTGPLQLPAPGPSTAGIEDQTDECGSTVSTHPYEAIGNVFNLHDYVEISGGGAAGGQAVVEGCGGRGGGRRRAERRGEGDISGEMAAVNGEPEKTKSHDDDGYVQHSPAHLLQSPSPRRPPRQ